MSAPPDHFRYVELSDAVLVTAVAKQQHDALAEIYRRHGGPAVRLSSRLLNDQRSAEDVCQEVFLALWKSPESFDAERGSLRSWILMKTHSRSVDIVRANAARYQRESREVNEPSKRDYDLEREVWDLTVADRIQRALTELPTNEKDAVQLAYFGGLTYREVAKELGQPEGTVKSRIRNGLKSLGRLLHDLQVENPSPSRPTVDSAPKTVTELATTELSPRGTIDQKNRWGR
jgi:RNA polymerase sigma-70 factor, ECF subfamily